MHSLLEKANKTSIYIYFLLTFQRFFLCSLVSPSFRMAEIIFDSQYFSVCFVSPFVTGVATKSWSINCPQAMTIRVRAWSVSVQSPGARKSVLLISLVLGRGFPSRPVALGELNAVNYKFDKIYILIISEHSYMYI